MVPWKKLTLEAELEIIKKESENAPILIFKHSTRCSVSSAAKDRLERKWNANEKTTIVPYFLDLISYRSVSNRIAEEFGIVHQSPQVLLIKSGKAVYNTSHMNINLDEIKGNA